MTREEALHRIRTAAARGELFRVHLEHPALYARARRMWGTWGAAVAAAGVDYAQILNEARRRAADSRRAGHGGRKR